MYITKSNIHKLDYAELKKVQRSIRSEFHMQLVLIDYLQKNNILHHTPINEMYGRVKELLSDREFKKYAKIGFQRGAPDIMIIEPNNKYKALFIELKHKRGRLKDTQLEYLVKSNLLGACGRWVNNITDAVVLISLYLHNRKIDDNNLKYTAKIT